MKRLPLIVTLGIACLMSSAHSADLLQAWQSAQARDPEIAAARALFEQAAFRKEQAQALWAPTVGAMGTIGVGGADSRIKGAEALGYSDVSFKTNINVGALARGNISAQKAWINPEREAQSQQLQLSAQLAEQQWQQAQQALVLRTAQKYFDVLSAEQTMQILQRQQKTVQQAETEIKKRQAVGDASVMDVQEANARVSDIRARVLTQENDLAMKQLAYRQLVGHDPINLRGLSSTNQMPANLSDANTWVQRAKQHSAALQMKRLQQAIQEHEVKRVKADQGLRADWVAQAQLDRLMGQGMYGSASNQTAQYLVGVQVNVPLSTGGMSQARELEALKQVDKLRFDQELAELQLEQSVRTAWQSISSAQARIQALEQSAKASQARLSATRNAHRTGARTTNEWLAAEHDAAQAELALVQLRIQTILERLQLYADSGELAQAQLQEINELLK
ncbi:MAG: transporter [Limnohabitans sp.]|nr:transporter [Limnohabitans sp.]